MWQSILNWFNSTTGFITGIAAIATIASSIINGLLSFIIFYYKRKHNKKNSIKEKLKEEKDNRIHLLFNNYFSKHYVTIRITSTSGRNALNFLKLYKVYFTYNSLSRSIITNFYNKYNNIHSLNKYFSSGKSVASYYFHHKNKLFRKYVKPKEIKSKEFKSINKILIMNNSNRTYTLNIPKSDIAWALMSGCIWISRKYGNKYLKQLPYLPYIIFIFENLTEKKLYVCSINIAEIFIYTKQFNKFEDISRKWLNNNNTGSQLKYLKLPPNFYKYTHYHVLIKAKYKKYFDK